MICNSNLHSSTVHVGPHGFLENIQAACLVKKVCSDFSISILIISPLKENCIMETSLINFQMVLESQKWCHLIVDDWAPWNVKHHQICQFNHIRRCFLIPTIRPNRFDHIRSGPSSNHVCMQTQCSQKSDASDTTKTTKSSSAQRILANASFSDGAQTINFESIGS